MSKKSLAVIIVLIIIAVGAVISLRVFSGEDKWVCENQVWVKHGNPASPKPTQGCGPVEKSTTEQMTEIFSQKYNRPANSITVKVTTDTGTFAKGTYNEQEGGGAIWFAKKTENGWELAFDGNGIVPCDIANKYEFPKDMIPQCIDLLHNNALIQR